MFLRELAAAANSRISLGISLAARQCFFGLAAARMAAFLCEISYWALPDLVLSSVVSAARLAFDL
jgi:hypothetical protein